MNKKDELLRVYLERKTQYFEKIQVKGAFFCCEGILYPIKLLFLPHQNDEGIIPKAHNYGDLLLIDDSIDSSTFIKIVESLGANTEISIASFPVKIPLGYFRGIDENPGNIQAEGHGYSALWDSERKLLKQTRSNPRSVYAHWPCNVYLYNFFLDTTCSNLYSHRSSLPLPLKTALPLFPDYRSAIAAWLNREVSNVQDGMIVFYIPSYLARVTNVKLAKDRLIVNIERGIAGSEIAVAGKYYTEYLNSCTSGEIDLNNTNQIIITDKVVRFYFVLYDKNAGAKLDYRDYTWGHDYYGNQEDNDLEYDFEESIEYFLSAGENEEIEFKLEIENDSTNKEFLESVCSFANAKGGKIFVGIDDSGNVKGLDDNKMERYRNKLPALIRNWIEPRIEVDAKEVEVRGKKLLITIVPGGDKKPYNYRDQGFFIRAGSTDRLASRDDILSILPREYQGS